VSEIEWKALLREPIKLKVKA